MGGYQIASAETFFFLDGLLVSYMGCIKEDYGYIISINKSVFKRKLWYLKP